MPTSSPSVRQRSNPKAKDQRTTHHNEHRNGEGEGERQMLLRRADDAHVSAHLQIERSKSKDQRSAREEIICGMGGGVLGAPG